MTAIAIRPDVAPPPDATKVFDAISYRNEMAVKLASDLLRVASENGSEGWVSRDGRGVINGGYAKRATDIEALTAVIL